MEKQAPNTLKNSGQINAMTEQRAIDLSAINGEFINLQGIQEIREHFSKFQKRGIDKRRDIAKDLAQLLSVADSYLKLGDIKNAQETLLYVIDTIQQIGANMTKSPDIMHEIGSIFKRAHFMLAPYSFHHYLISMEWNMPPESKFYASRFCVLGEWAKEMQKLEDGEYRILGLSAPPRSGKEQPISAKVLTPCGWATMGSLKVGDVVTASDGTGTKVVEIFPQGVKDVYCMTFSDGTSAECGIDHLWSVYTRTNREYNRENHVDLCSVLSTREIIEKMKTEKRRIAVKLMEPAHFVNKISYNDLNPRLYGYLLIRARIRKGKILFTPHGSYDREKVAKLISKFDKLEPNRKSSDRNVWQIVHHGESRQSETLKQWERLGIDHINEKYQFLALDQRIQLFLGFMDGAGYFPSIEFKSGKVYKGEIYFHHECAKIAEDFVNLARSLGGYAKMGSSSHGHHFSHPVSFCVSLSESRSELPNMFKYKYIRKVDKVRREECQCIVVDNPRHEYVTNDFTVTHNTGIETLYLTWLMGRHSDKSMMFVTHTARMAKKVYSDVLKLINNPIRGWNIIYPGRQIHTSAEDLFIDVQPKHNFNNYCTIYFTSIDSQKAGVMEATHLICVDDLIGGIEEASNPIRLENAWTKYTTDVLQRKVGDVALLHIATRWSLHDVLTTVEREHADDPKARFIRIPGLNENGESNFMFKYNPLTKEHFLSLKKSMDRVSFEAIIQQNPVERDGLVFSMQDLKFFDMTQLPDGEPDEIVCACDVAFGGGDYLCLVIAMVFAYDVYITDVVFSNKPKHITIPMVESALIRNNVQRGEFEANSGGDAYAEDIKKRLRERGVRCLITSKRAPVMKSKLSRILDAQSEIKAQIDDGTGYNLHFLSVYAREKNPMYETYIQQLCQFNQSARFLGKQHDDAADATAMLVNSVLNHKARSAKISYLNSSKFKF